MPIVISQVSPVNASANAPAATSVNYEPVGLRTDLSMREGSTVIAGTLNVGPSGDALVVAICAKRAN